MSNEKYDFKALGQAIKATRIIRELSSELFGEILDFSRRYIMSIENNGQHPSFQVFYELATYFHISVDQFFFPESTPEKSSVQRRVESLLDEMDDTELIILEATAKGIKEAKERRAAAGK